MVELLALSANIPHASPCSTADTGQGRGSMQQRQGIKDSISDSIKFIKSNSIKLIKSNSIKLIKSIIPDTTATLML